MKWIFLRIVCLIIVVDFVLSIVWTFLSTDERGHISSTRKKIYEIGKGVLFIWMKFTEIMHPGMQALG